MCTKSIFKDFVHDFRSQQNLGNIIFDDETIMMYMEKEEVQKFEFEVPEGFQLRPLSIEDAFKVNENWAHKSPGSINFIEYNIKFNPNVGLYNEQNELISWCLTHDFRLLLNLYTVKDHLRKGYAEIVTKAISKILAEKHGCDVTACIIVKNFKSLNLFNKLGFKEIDRTFWIGIDKKNSSE
jgi:RimJ/RimL family protein N-acetyltransferase